ncbi:Bloom syndrome [Mycena venus]|uniref:DNA 3'-5' helicase n=1 Tax=Mycena venus TaxID=2733690 RepID=A0A8H6Y7Y2_9AGAR|nr:Bloom syndrome [Mycena venus]
MPAEQDEHEAREKARRKNKYDSAKTRRDLARLFQEQERKDAYEWQIDVAEALILGLDAVVIAGTGAGKTIPFMLPVLLHRDKFVLIISPLKILQEDQANRFKQIGLKAAAVNGDTYSRELQKARQLHNASRDLHTQTHNAILTSPEMCFEHQDFRKFLRDDKTGKRILAVIVDEAHCAAQWAGDFRPHYGMLNRLRALLPVGTPILATSATLSPSVLTEVCSGLDLDLDTSFFMNLGNDRPNITPSVVEMNSGKDYAAIDPHLPNPEDVHSRDDLPKGIIFTNAVKKTQVICRHIRQLYPQCRGAIDFLHAHRTAKAKRRIMKQFRKGKIKILVATEAAGMVRDLALFFRVRSCLNALRRGADIPDIEFIIQFGVPSSLAVWIQRAGRAGRSYHIRARAILLVEKSMFQRRKRRKKGGGKEKSAPFLDPDSDSDGSSDSDGGEAAHAEPVVDGMEWGKNVDPVMREYISTTLCRRDMTDRYFNNPLRREPTGDCCDNCIAMQQPSPSPPPKTPEPVGSPSSSVHSTPSKDRNANGKRAMVRGAGPKTRCKDHLKRTRSALESWRVNTYLRDYSSTSLTYEVLLPDVYLRSVASHRSKDLDELGALIPGWAFFDEHGEDVLLVLSRVDNAVREEREQEKAANKLARRQEMLQRQADREAERAANAKPAKKTR